MKHAVRTILLVGSVAVLATSCSSSDDALTLLPGSQANREAASDSMMWGNVEFVVKGTLAQMPTSFASYTAKKQSVPTAEVEKIAKVFGVTGDLVEDTVAGGDFESSFRSYRIDAGAGSEPSMWVSGDGYMWWWNYLGDNGSLYPGGDTAVSSEPCPPDSPRCEEYIPTPPKNLPTSTEVETLTKDLLSEIGVDLSKVQIQAYSDEWSAWSSAIELLNGVASATGWYFSFGEDAALMSASGSIVDTKKSTTYRLADPTEAVSRLTDYRYSGFATASDASMRAEMSTGELSVDDTEMETFVIEITSVRMAYTTMTAEKGQLLFVPAYVYSNSDGDVGTVIALSDDVFTFAESPVPNTDGGQPEPAPGSDTGDSNSGDVVIPQESANKIIGLREDEAMKVAASNGWEFRVSARDGEQYMLTTDYIPNRVNVVIVDGEVTEVSVG
jgi:hypothetical protein